MERIPEFITNHLFLFCLLISILMLLVWNLFGDSLSGIKSLAPHEVTRLINRDDARVIDLRRRAEFEAGHIIDAVNIDPAQLEGQMEKLKKYRAQGVIFCCASGGVSAREARRLLRAGFDKVYTLKGGLYAWQNASLPLAKGLK